MAVDKKEKPVEVFLSYAAKDKDRAGELKQLLLQQPNVRVTTSDMFSAGGNWPAQLQDAIRKCDLFIVLASPHSLESSWVMLEFGAAFGMGRPLVVVLTRRELITRIPAAMQAFQAIDLKDLKKPKILSELLERTEKRSAA